MKELKPETWGNLKASRRLVNVLLAKGNDKQTRKACSLIDFYLVKTKHLESIHKDSYQYFLQLLLKLTEDKINHSEFDELVRRYLLHTIRTFHKEKIKKHISKFKYYRLKIEITNTSLTKNRLFKEDIKIRGINFIDNGKEKFVPFSNEEYFELVIK